MSSVSSAGGPLGVFLGGQAFELPGELAVLIVLSVRPGLRKVEVTLVFQRLGRGTVDDPVFMELVKVLGCLQRDDDCGQAAGYPHDCAGQS